MPGIMDGTSKALIAEVEYATKQGTEELQKGEKEKALGLFQVHEWLINSLVEFFEIYNGKNTMT